MNEIKRLSDKLYTEVPSDCRKTNVHAGIVEGQISTKAPVCPPPASQLAFSSREKSPSVDPRQHNSKRLDRPSSARLGGSVNRLWNTVTPPGTSAGGFRPSSGGRDGGGGGWGAVTRSRTRVPNMSPSPSSSQLFPPTALSATLGPLSEAARRVSLDLCLEHHTCKAEVVCSSSTLKRTCAAK